MKRASVKGVNQPRRHSIFGAIYVPAFLPRSFAPATFGVGRFRRRRRDSSAHSTYTHQSTPAKKMKKGKENVDSKVEMYDNKPFGCTAIHLAPLQSNVHSGKRNATPRPGKDASGKPGDGATEVRKIPWRTAVNNSEERVTSVL